MWITAAGNPDTFAHAGELGANVLTHLLGQTVDEVAANIALYRRTLAANGHDPSARRVTMMIHTYLDEDHEEALRLAKTPFMNYLRGHVDLLSLVPQSQGHSIKQVQQQDLEVAVELAFERYSRTAALIGSPRTCSQMVGALADAGVNEIACLIDWMNVESALQGLGAINDLRLLSLDAPPSAKALRRHCATLLPEYMVPSHFVMLDALPVTPNGKLDRKSLPEPEAMRFESEYVAPRTRTERAIATVWTELLRRDKVGINDNFFHLGGHSLLATQMLSKLCTVFDLELPLRALFESATLGDLAQRIDLESEKHEVGEV